MKEVPFSNTPKPEESGKKWKTSGNDRIPLVRTYRADVQELITKKKITRTHVAIAEEERRRAIGESSVWEDPKPTSMVPPVIAGVLILIGIAMIFSDIALKSVKEFVSPAPQATFVVPGTLSQTIWLQHFTYDELVKNVQNTARTKKLPQGSLLRMNYMARTGTTTLPFPLKNFFRTLESDPPDTFLRSISSSYEGGLISTGEVKGYLIFTSTFYENTVLGLGEWELAMTRDLYPIIDPLRAGLNSRTPEGSWRNQTWGAHQLRVFETPDQRVVLLYGWVDRHILIVTGNIQAFGELHRLLSL